MATDHALNAIFRFRHQQPSDDQTPEFCEQLVEVTIGAILAKEDDGDAVMEDDRALDDDPPKRTTHLDPLLHDRDVPLNEFSRADRRALDRAWLEICPRASEARPKRDEIWTERWFPEYASVLQVECVGVNTVMLRLLGLDGWQRVIHSLPGDVSIHSAVPTTHEVFHCGRLTWSKYGAFCGELSEQLRKAIERTGMKRNAAHGEGPGHQKTPAFLCSAIRTAVDKTMGKTHHVYMPAGGTTDVGLHTGGAQRDTCWPLVRTALRQALPGSSALFDKVLLRLKSSLVQTELKRLAEISSKDDVKTFWDKVDTTFAALQDVAVLFVEKIDGGYGSAPLQSDLRQWRDELEVLVRAWSERTASSFTLPSGPELTRLCSAAVVPTLDPPALQDLLKKLPTEDARVKALHANQGYEVLDGTLCSTESLLEYLDSVGSSSVEDHISFARRTVEVFMYRAGSELASGQVVVSCSPPQLLRIVNWYAGRHEMFAKERQFDEMARVTTDSKLLLMSWIAFCLCHIECCRTYPALALHSIPLDWKRLGVAVLPERSARETLKQVARYLQEWNGSSKPLRAVFDFNNHDGTMAFARTMGQTLSQFSAMYAQHVAAWDVHRAAMWNAVNQRKERVAEVRDELAQQQRDLKRAEADLRDEQARASRGFGRRTNTWEFDDLEAKIKRLKKSMRANAEERDRLLRMDEFMVSPLPENANDARAVLFLIFMPLELDILARFCGQSQRRLGPRDPSPFKVTAQCKTTWFDHFTRRGVAQVDSTATTSTTAFPLQLQEPTSFGPTSIDYVATREQFVRTCSWFPRGDRNEILWKDPSGIFVNPSLIGESDSLMYFIANFWVSEPSGEELCWTLAYPGGERRGNLTYAKSEAIGLASTDFPAYTSLGSLRAQPVQQLRRLFEALQGDVLDWADTRVVTIVKQAIYQVGDLTESASPSFIWHVDLESSESVGEFSSIIGALARKIDSSPSKWKMVPLLGEVADFLDQYASRTDCRQGVRFFTRTLQRWAKEDRAKWRSGVSAEECRELRTHECLLYAIALMAYKCEPCSEEDLRDVCELIVLFGNALLFAVGDLRATVQEATNVVRQVMAIRIAEIMQFVAQSPHETLSQLCGLVNERISTGLQWALVSSSSCCFQATSADGETHYLINLSTGSILTNGEPPGGLPAAVRQNETFVALFGDQDFEVNRTEDVYSCAHSLGGCHYKFRVVNNELIVEECSASANLQLCSSAWLEEFAAEFPRTLVNNFAHWIWSDGGCVLLRQKQVSKRDAYFVITFRDGEAVCGEVPRAYQGDQYSEVVLRSESYNVVVVHEEAIIRAVRKFEDPSFVHIMRSPAMLFEIYLPRFGLRFQQNSNGDLASLEYKGYVLATKQQLTGQMQRFRRYIILKRSTAECEKAELQLVVPCGEVDALGNGLVDIVINGSSSASVPVAVMDEHARLKTLSAESLESRLLLAAIFAASDSLMPWSDLGMTGGEAANELMRGCSSTRPLSDPALVSLHSIRRSSYHSITSRVLAVDLIRRAERLAFLFGKDGVVVGAMDSVDDLDAYTATCKRAVIQESHFRKGLRNKEERSALGVSVLHVSKASQRDSLLPVAKLLDVPVDEDFVRTQESRLMRFIACSELTEPPPFPLTNPAMNTMGAHMIDEVKESWVAHHSVQQQMLVVELDVLVAECRILRDEVITKRDMMWRYLIQAVDSVQSESKDLVLRSAGLSPHLTKTDVLRAVLDEDVLLYFAPRLSEQGRRLFKQGALRFMELCVLEDKLERIISRAESAMPSPLEYFVEELSSVRQWKSEEHPYWLAFEVEGRLQIRPEQYIIARHLIENPGSICQLNMGRGKTRVILPMLFLYYRHSNTDRVVRSHFLAPLLSETRQFMHRVLSAGALRVPFAELPFDRTKQLDLNAVLLMQEAIDDVKRHGGFLMIAPEHRLSLELKQVEIKYATSSLDDGEDLCEALDGLLDPSQFIDVFDESDALLHHKYHLVYAIGVPAVLDGGSCRWLAAQALLRVLTAATSQRTQRVLQAFPNIFNVQPEYGSRRGAFDGFRLNGVTDDKSNHRRAWRQALVEDLMDHAPYELSWLSVFSKRDPAVRVELISALTQCEVSCDAILQQMPDEIENVKEQILALRGLLAYGVLENCLEKRNRVSFGLPEPGSRPKQLAIPFTAADLPAERSEFSHPDVSITLTLIAFYHVGLNDGDIRKTFKSLFRLDQSERIYYYTEWFKSIEPKLNTETHELLHNLDHVSLDNVHQFAVVCDAYRFSMAVINFFLNQHVFPRDTKQYPQRLSRSAWDLAHGSTKVGFSGTNDTHRLLPLGVTQREPGESALRGTNGKMIDLLLTTTIGYETIPHHASADANSLDRAKDRENDALWQRLALHALSKGCKALIDTGALLAGVGLHGVAQFLLEQPGFDAAGVTYYNARKEFNCWVVLERERQLLLPLKSSAIHERETFVIFDEARSRGSDMKLLPDAVALLTLGPAITKDKLMQGAGRMRQLGCNQRLWISSTCEVYDFISSQQEPGVGTTREATIVDVLEWVMRNTQEQSTFGLLEWADNGIRFCEKLASSEKELQDEDWRLHGMYGDAVEERLVHDIVANRLHVASDMLGDGESVSSMTTNIESHARTYGLNDYVQVTGFAEECERELQVEEEEEVEDEISSLVLEPCSDKSWNYRELLHASSVGDLRNVVPMLSVQEAVQKFFSPREIHDLAWGSLNLFGTENFWSTVHLPSSHADFIWNGFMRMANIVLVFPDSSVLMLSEREADAVLKMLLVGEAQKVEHVGSRPRGLFGLLHVDFALHALSGASDNDPEPTGSDEDTSRTTEPNESISLQSIPLSLGFSAGKVQVPANMSISVTVIIACRLLNGDTHFASHSHRALMERVLRPLIQPIRCREQALRSFMEARRMTQRWSMSFLHDLTKRMDLEDCEIKMQH